MQDLRLLEDPATVDTRKAAIDDRLVGRYPYDPPELLTLVRGSSQWHMGLWYDAPGERPPLVVSTDGGDIHGSERTLLEVFRERIESAEPRDLVGWDSETVRERRLWIGVLREGIQQYETAERREIGDAYFKAYVNSPKGRVRTRDGFGAWVDGIERDRDIESVSRDVRGGELESFVASAIDAASRGEPAEAIALGRDVLSLSNDDRQVRRAAAIRLFESAYRALDRNALASIVAAYELGGLWTTDDYDP